MQEKAAQLVSKMTLDEKIAQLTSVWMNIEKDGQVRVKSINGMSNEVGEADVFHEIRLGIGQITRPLGSQDITPRQGVKALNRIQKFLVESTRLGIPALPHEECLSGLMAQGGTIFPSGINNGATWDPELIRKIGKAIGDELYSVGSRQGLAPVLDVCRDARWGRTEETYGEDPYLTAVLGTAYVQGLQDESRPLIATLKHFAAHSFSEGARNHAPVRIGDREMNDLFLFPFEMAIRKGAARSLMPAYHDIDGEPLHQSVRFLKDLLRNTWDFKGTIVSDYEGLIQLITDHGTQPDKAHAAAAALKAGIDTELPGNTLFGEGIKKALEDNLLLMDDVNEAVKRGLLQKMSIGLFDNPYIGEEAITLQSRKTKNLAARAAEKSLVLLKNRDVLPLKKNQKVALVGPLASEPMAMMGGYAFPVHLILSEKREGESVLPTLRDTLDKALEGNLLYTPGCRILTGRPDKPAVFPGDIVQDGSRQQDYISFDSSGIAEAVEQARNADVVLIAVGDLAGLFLSGTVGEGSDVSSLSLPGVQQQLIDAVLDVGKPTVVLVFSGRPYDLESCALRADGLMQCWLPGQEGAFAVTRALMGDVNPGGKLPLSFPRSAGAMPYYYNHKMKSAGTPIQKDFGALYPFGFGLSYTKFRLTAFTMERNDFQMHDQIRFSLDVENPGEREGDEVIQIYLRDPVARYVRPIRELKGFHRVNLAGGEKKTLHFSLPVDLLSYSISLKERLLEPGEYQLMVGTSSRDIWEKRVISLIGEERVLGREWTMVTEVTES
ncbi:MAG: glycoside hydrolase family 3 C-terminal domain-containing protein [Spirochaetales bacterium]|nr:glycoside hydrolase family 3 C-terminal domain-containing protein [Spirochaetales bacterium]